jgi:hypothetical protein
MADDMRRPAKLRSTGLICPFIAAELLTILLLEALVFGSPKTRGNPSGSSTSADRGLSGRPFLRKILTRDCGGD